jgi:hypothetical protein
MTIAVAPPTSAPVATTVEVVGESLSPTTAARVLPPTGMETGIVVLVAATAFTVGAVLLIALSRRSA